MGVEKDNLSSVKYVKCFILLMIYNYFFLIVGYNYIYVYVKYIFSVDVWKW